MFLRRAALLALLPLTLAACDSKMLSNLPGFGKPEAAPAAPVAPATPRAPAVSPLEVPIEVEGQRTTLGTANAAFVNVANFTASGPGWVAAVRGNNAAVRRAGVKDAQVNVRRVDFGQGTEFVGTYAERTASINLRAADCRDASGARWPMSATLRVAGAKLEGCAAPSGSEPKGFDVAALPVPKAVAAAAPAAKKATPKKAAPKKPVTPAKPAPTTSPEPATTTPTTPTPATPAPSTTTTPAPTTSTTPATTTPAPAATPTPTTTPAAPTTPAPAATTPAPSTPAATAPAPAPAATTPAPATTGSSTTVPVVIPPAN
ncbi:hypothetical protein DRW48_08115 [Paracoccus suum]|uniref:Uncharacterized protein n=1 Tax=Paracoccus suum TaxID=2259340 RepID=A0A344PJV4_9RHOB|nr:hypothetical protein [Paracoccus suum]AXC49659.1 hypothetical protein DRW48_08115 [Paracoccus suum]